MVIIPRTKIRTKRKIDDYKEHRNSYKTKSGGIWRGQEYFRKGSYKKSRGWIKYKRKRRR